MVKEKKGEEKEKEGLEKEGEEKEGLPWYEARFHTCLLCEEEVPLGRFSSHLRQQHRTTFSAYRYYVRYFKKFIFGSGTRLHEVLDIV